MKYIMLTGHRKSGTTLLHKLFDNHPELNVYPVDLTLLYAYYPCWLNLESTDKKKKRVSDVIKHATQSIEGRSVSEHVPSFSAEKLIESLWKVAEVEYFDEPGRIVEAMANAYCDYAGLDKGKPFLFKETSQTVHARAMVEIGLDINVIQIVRDPRDNYAAIKSGVSSYYSKMGEGEKESLASLLNRAGLDLRMAQRLTMEEVLWFDTIGFESLVEEPQAHLRRTCDFLEISFSEALAKPTLLGQPFEGNSHEAKSFTGISQENVGKWKDRISRSEAAVIEAWMEREIEYWGYELSSGLDERLFELSSFYDWYNCRYFYHDSVYSFSKA